MEGIIYGYCDATGELVRIQVDINGHVLTATEA